MTGNESTIEPMLSQSQSPRKDLDAIMTESAPTSPTSPSSNLYAGDTAGLASSTEVSTNDTHTHNDPTAAIPLSTNDDSNSIRTPKPKPKCDCSHYHRQGLGCPCSAVYAAKVGRKATERILNQSKFFIADNVLIQQEFLDDSNHSTANRLLKCDPESIHLGPLLGKGGFCVVYAADFHNDVDLGLYIPDSDTSEHGSDAAEHGSDAAASANHDVDMHDTNKSTKRHHRDYCVKFLKPSVLLERKKFARGVADLAIEAHFLASFNHPHILKIRGVSQGFKLFQPSSPEFLTSLTHQAGLDGGCFLVLDKLAVTLDRKINTDWKPVQEKWNSFLNRTFQDMRGSKRKYFKLERIKVVLQLAQAMQYLHQHNVVYRDLKPDNIGFDSRDSLKLFDFGLAKELKDSKRHADGTYQLTANTGSKRYMAPEVASRERYNLSVDVFSFGILFWEICSLEKPFDGFTELQHMNLVVQRGHRPKLDDIKYWPISVRHVISRCWHPISNQRPSFKQVVDALMTIQKELSESS